MSDKKSILEHAALSRMLDRDKIDKFIPAPAASPPREP